MGKHAHRSRAAPAGRPWHGHRGQGRLLQHRTGRPTAHRRRGHGSRGDQARGSRPSPAGRRLGAGGSSGRRLFRCRSPHEVQEGCARGHLHPAAGVRGLPDRGFCHHDRLVPPRSGSKPPQPGRHQRGAPRLGPAAGPEPGRQRVPRRVPHCPGRGRGGGFPAGENCAGVQTPSAGRQPQRGSAGRCGGRPGRKRRTVRVGGTGGLRRGRDDGRRRLQRASHRRVLQRDRLAGTARGAGLPEQPPVVHPRCHRLCRPTHGRRFPGCDGSGSEGCRCRAGATGTGLLTPPAVQFLRERRRAVGAAEAGGG